MKPQHKCEWKLELESSVAATAQAVKTLEREPLFGAAQVF